MGCAYHFSLGTGAAVCAKDAVLEGDFAVPRKWSFSETRQLLREVSHSTIDRIIKSWVSMFQRKRGLGRRYSRPTAITDDHTVLRHPLS